MLHIPRLYVWAVAHPEAAFALAAAFVALLRAVYAAVTRLVRPYPRIRAAVEAIAALAPDVARFGLQVARVLTGRALPSPALDSRDQTIADMRTEIDHLRGTVARMASTQVPPRAAPAPVVGSSGRGDQGGQMGYIRGPVLLLGALVGALALAILIGIHGCGPDAPTPDPAAGTVRVYVADGWISADRPDIALALRQLAATGPVWIESDRAAADVELRPWVSPDCTRIGGRHVVGSRVAEVDPVCARGDAHRRAMIEHELLHALGALHVCRHANDGADCSPTIEAARAVLMPAPLVLTDDGDEAAIELPTEADRAELARVRAVSR